MNTKILVLSLLLNLVSCASMSKDCVECTKKTVGKEVQPDSKPVADLKKDVEPSLMLASKGPLVIAKSEGRMPAGDNDSSRDSFLRASCIKFEMAQDTVDVETLIEDMEESPYANSMVEFWTTPACRSSTKDGSLVPIVFNTAKDVVRSENFPQIVHDYFVNDKKDSQTWLNAINTKSNDGLTFLDSLQFNLKVDYYRSKPTRDAALRVVDYLCKNGGVYSKYKDTAKCP